MAIAHPSTHASSPRDLSVVWDKTREVGTWCIAAGGMLAAAAGAFSDSVGAKYLRGGAILLAIAAFSLLLRTRDRVNLLHDTLVKNDRVERMDDGITLLSQKIAGVEVSNYASVGSYYAELQRVLLRSTRTVSLTQIRDERLSDQGDEAIAWQSALDSWLAAAPGRVVKRVMSTPTPTMAAWADELALKLDGRDDFQVRKICGEAGVPALNFALFDDKAVLIAISGPTRGAGGGLGVENVEIARYFATYFDRLFLKAEPVNRIA